MKVIRAKTYQKKLSKLLCEEEMLEKEHEILAFPEKWPVIAGTGGIRKARISRGTSGKSGGLRVIYYFWVAKDSVYFLDVYAKNEKENLTASDKKILRNLIDILKSLEN